MKKIILWIGSLLLLLGLASIPFLRSKKSEAPQYQFGEVTRGVVQSTVSSTGALQAVGTVNVGTQVSGTISALFVDFNDQVRKGDRLAELDPSLLAANVRDAEANLLRAEAQLREAQAEFDRQKPLQEKGFLSQLEFLPLETGVAVAQAAVTSARSALERARTNLGYSTILAPIDGTIIERSIDAGQTVAASFNTPTLFVIAEDLSKMEIYASVDESDRGQIRLIQKVYFTVQAYPDEEFRGIVRQIRLKPTTISNVVSYTVVVDASNERGLLMPGMTATVDFVTGEVEDVFRVPNGALRFEPTADQLKELGVERIHTRDMKRGDHPARSGDNRLHPAEHDSPGGRIWTLEGDGKLRSIPVMTGLSDGKLTAVVNSDALSEGLKVITGASGVSPSEAKKTTILSGIRHPRGMR